VTPAVHVVAFTLNGRPVSAQVSSCETLIEMLHASFGLHGAHESCGQGLCGCCTVIVDGKAVSACLVLAALIDACEVVTVEHLEQSGHLNPTQQAFVDCAAFQCGFCTPGFILMTEQLLAQHPDPTDAQIRDYLSGNLCRCGTYPQIIQAVKLAAQRRARPSDPALVRPGGRGDV
jgi:carbon-monoxide dehydrogenase small subunit